MGCVTPLVVDGRVRGEHTTPSLAGPILGCFHQPTTYAPSSVSRIYVPTLEIPNQVALDRLGVLSEGHFGEAQYASVGSATLARSMPCGPTKP